MCGADAAASANLEELAEHVVLAALADEAEGGCVPERGGAPVAEHDLPALAQAEQLVQALPHRTDEVLHRRLPMRRAEQVAVGLGEREHLFGAHLGRATSEPSVGRQQIARDDDGAGIYGHMHSLVTAEPCSQGRGRKPHPRADGGGASIPAGCREGARRIGLLPH